MRTSTSGSRESGQATVLAIGLVFGVLVAVGLVWDGTRMLVARSRLQAVADSAALAGATGIDAAWVTGADLAAAPSLDPRSAEAAARRSLELSALQQAPLAFTADRVSVGRYAVDVSVSARVEMSFLVLVGLRSFDVVATAEASPRQLSR